MNAFMIRAGPIQDKVVHLKTVHFIIPSFKGEKSLKACLDSIAQQDYPPELIRIIVVENGPKTNIESILKSYPQSIYYYHPVANRSIARNLPLSYIQSELVAFIDVDVVLSRTWLKKNLQNLQSPFCAASTGPVMRKGNRWLDNVRRKISEYSTNGLFNTMERPGSMSCMNTAAVLMRTTVLKATGGFDPAFLRSEDLELTHRLLRSGYILSTKEDAFADVYWDRGIFEYFVLRSFQSGVFSAKADSLHKISMKDGRKSKRYLHPGWVITNWFYKLGFLYGQWRFKNVKPFVPPIHLKKIHLTGNSLPLSHYVINPKLEVTLIRNEIRLYDRELQKHYALHKPFENILREMIETSFYHISIDQDQILINQMVKDQLLLVLNPAKMHIN